MARLRIDIPDQAFEELRRQAIANLRMPEGQATVILLESLGFPVPLPPVIDVNPEPVSEEVRALPAG